MPHQQLDQQPEAGGFREALASRVLTLSGVSEAPSGVSLPGARAFVLERTAASGPTEAFLTGQEFAHLHPGHDHSLHACLPDQLVNEACEKGWAEPHPLALSGRLPKSHVMVYAPRDESELQVVGDLLEASYRFAAGVETDAVAPAPDTGRAGAAAGVALRGFRHVGLSVSEVDRAVAWYQDVLGFVQAFREDRPGRKSCILRIPDTNVILGLVEFDDGSHDRFTPLRTGLDHLCLTAGDLPELEGWVARLDEKGVSHSGLLMMKTGPIVNFTDPDGIALAIALVPVAAG